MPPIDWLTAVYLSGKEKIVGWPLIGSEAVHFDDHLITLQDHNVVFVHFICRVFIEMGWRVSKGNYLVIIRIKMLGERYIEGYHTFSVQIQKFITKPTFEVFECGLKNEHSEWPSLHEFLWKI